MKSSVFQNQTISDNNRTFMFQNETFKPQNRTFVHKNPTFIPNKIKQLNYEIKCLYLKSNNIHKNRTFTYPN